MIKVIKEVSEYKGQKTLQLACTQLGAEYSSTRKKEIVVEWIDFFMSKPDLSKVGFYSKANQQIFDAICELDGLQSLYIKWSGNGIVNLDKLNNLMNLKYLGLGSCTQIRNITMITNLEHLYLENFRDVQDYSCLKSLQNLISLTINGDIFAPKKIKLKSIEFLNEMPKLERLDLSEVSIQDKSWMPILSLKNLVELRLTSMIKKDIWIEILNTLTKLEGGNLVNHYKEKYAEYIN